MLDSKTTCCPSHVGTGNAATLARTSPRALLVLRACLSRAHVSCDVTLVRTAPVSYPVCGVVTSHGVGILSHLRCACDVTAVGVRLEGATRARARYV